MRRRARTSRALPFRDATFDIAISSHVAEHLTQPERVFGELSRVLKPGGRLLILTPNRWHYVTVSSALLPHSFHLHVQPLARRRCARHLPDGVPREHGVAAARAVRRTRGCSVEQLQQFETEPEYLAFSTPTYALGVGVRARRQPLRCAAQLAGQPARGRAEAVARALGTTSTPASVVLFRRNNQVISTWR